jgi:uncharacterized protein YceK
MKKLLVFSAVLSPGCMALKLGPSIYGATKLDIMAALNMSNYHMPLWYRLMFLIDLPFSFAIETATLPLIVAYELLKIIY